MHLIVISPPDLWPDETKIVTEMFQMGLQYFHLRKPELSKKELKNYIERIPKRYHTRIVIHYQFDLAHDYKLKGIHFNPGNVGNFDDLFQLRGIRTFAAKNFDEVISYRSKMDYIFLSPVYKTFSADYQDSTLKKDELRYFLNRKNCPKLVALGGVKEEYIPELREMGFWGAALLSEIWSTSISTENTLSKVEDMIKILY